MDAMEIYSVNQWFISFAASLLYQYNVTYQIRHKLHTHPFNGPFSGTTRLGRYQKGKTSLDFTEARDSEWQWHQLGHMQVCTSLQTDNHASTSPLKFFLHAGCPSCRSTNCVKGGRDEEGRGKVEKGRGRRERKDEGGKGKGSAGKGRRGRGREEEAGEGKRGKHLEHVLASLKRSGGLTRSFAGKGHRKFGGNRIPSYLNTSIALEPMNHPEF